MKEWLLDFLCCPECKKKLKFKLFKAKEEEILDGILFCSCKRWYPVFKGIPRLLWVMEPDDYYDYSDFMVQYKGELKNFSISLPKKHASTTSKKEVCGTYSFIWNKFSKFAINDPAKEKFYDKWMAKKLGLNSAKELYKFISQKELILEVGVGSGQKLKMMAEHSPGKVIGLDLTSGAEHAYKNTRSLENAGVVQANLFAPPFKKNCFDFIISDGVLHHTPDTRKAFLSIIPLLKRGGQISIRVYGKSGPIREFCDDYIRSYTTKMTEKEAWEFCKKLTKFGESLVQYKEEIVVPEDIEFLGIRKGKYNLQRFFYVHLFKCFHNEDFNFNENNLVNFDWYYPLDAHRHTKEEIYSWFKEAALAEIQIFYPDGGLSALGRRK